MENFSDLIRNRRSMRKFTDEELTQDQVLTLLKAALMAPSSKRSNCWQFIVVDDKDTLEKFLQGIGSGIRKRCRTGYCSDCRPARQRCVD